MTLRALSDPSRSPVLARDDLQLHDGMLHLRAPRATPWSAREEDLLLVADAFDAADVPLLLARRDQYSPILVVDLADRARALGALARAGEEHPLHAKVKSAPAVPIGDAVLSAGPSALRVFRPRAVAPGYRLGSREAVRLEFWEFGDERIVAPSANALLRASTPREDVRLTTVERFGRSWRTIEGMWDPHPHEFTDDVDIVFSWVDGSSTEFQRQRAAQLAEYVVGEGDDGPARFRHVDELRYALRSVHMYAPWIRRIFIATDSPAPSWLAEHPKVTIVRSEEFFADPSVLPTHNSHAVESQLHNIDGLSEHFLYSNDDMFFARAVSPDLFFTPGGVTRFVECDVRIGAGPRRTERSGHDNALRRNRELLRERFGRTVTHDLEHCATPLRRSVVAELEREFPDEFARTAAARFRSSDDVSVTNCLYHYYALFTGRATATRRARVRYVQTTLAASLRGIDRLVERRDIDMFCLNDGGSSEVPEELRVRAVCDALERAFPVPGPWEKEPAAVSSGRGSAASAVRSGASR